jgi:hypothetical protein
MDSEYINYMRRSYYPIQDKVLPLWYVYKFNLRTAAHLIMDDGSGLNGHICRIATHGFDLVSMETLKLSFRNIGLNVYQIIN